MADQRLTDKDFISSIADGDLFHLVDVSDPSANVNGTSKKGLFSLLKSTLKTYFDTLYQVVLVSGTNIKTINSESLLGSGNITIPVLTQSTKESFTSTAAQVDFVLSSTPNNVDVYINDIFTSDYTLTTNTVTLGESPITGSIVIIRKY